MSVKNRRGVGSAWTDRSEGYERDDSPTNQGNWNLYGTNDEGMLPDTWTDDASKELNNERQKTGEDFGNPQTQPNYRCTCQLRNQTR
jgi:hypothetical protein